MVNTPFAVGMIVGNILLFSLMEVNGERIGSHEYTMKICSTPKILILGTCDKLRPSEGFHKNLKILKAYHKGFIRPFTLKAFSPSANTDWPRVLTCQYALVSC